MPDMQSLQNEIDGIKENLDMNSEEDDEKKEYQSQGQCFNMSSPKNENEDGMLIFPE